MIMHGRTSRSIRRDVPAVFAQRALRLSRTEALPSGGWYITMALTAQAGWQNQTDWTVDIRPTGRYASSMKRTTLKPPDMFLDATEVVVARQGIANLTLDAVAAEARMSKGGLLHYFPSKDRLVEALVIRTAEGWRSCYIEAYERTPEGPGRMARALLDHCLSDAKCWTEELRRSSSAVFAALAQNPALIQPMRAVYADLHRRIAQDGLPPGVAEAVAAAIDGLWLDWVLGLVPLEQVRVVRVRRALENMLTHAESARRSSKAKGALRKRSGGHRI
jgi:AcrR family transcriptional regulator